MEATEKRWASKVGLVGLFEIKWTTPCHDWMVEFSQYLVGEIIDNLC
jgi:hypothetical protein